MAAVNAAVTTGHRESVRIGTYFSVISMPLPFRIRLGLAIVFLWFFIGGLAHFFLASVEIRIMPPYIPYPGLALAASGVFELLGAIGILIRRTRRWAGYGLALLTICVTPANIYMLQRPDLFPTIPVWALVARLFLQVLLIILILWSTRPPRGRRFARF